jgi:hypothetical protein
MNDNALPTNSPAALDASLVHQALNPMDLLAGQDFMVQGPKGLVVDLTKLEGNARLALLVAKAFQGGCYFKGLNYKNFAALLYDFARVKGQYPQLTLAAGLERLPQARLMLYQGELSLNSQEAHYDFTFRLDSRVNFAQGVQAPKGEQPPRNLDEFVAVMWNKGVRFGLDLAAVEQGLAVAKNKYLRLVIATYQPPQAGSDARLDELISLKKDLRPLESAEGQVDLRRYLCVFPQARAQQVILRKVPAQPGQVGHSVFGEVLPATPGQDMSLASRAGQGTTVATVNQSECLVAMQTGYVSVHPKSGAISVTDEVINHTPVGIKTGSLTLDVESCTQYGGVAAGYTLDVNTLNSKGGTIEGTVLSRHGNVKIQENVANGKVTALKGDIQVQGLVQSGSRLEAYNGRVSASLAENCLIVAREVVLRRAVNVTIIAQKAVIGECMGCDIFAFSLQIERVRPGLGRSAAGARASGTTLAAPIIEPPRRPLAIIEHTIQAVGVPMPDLVYHAEALGSDQEVQRYLRALKAYQAAKDEDEARRQQAIIQPLEARVKPMIAKWRLLLAEQKRIMEQKEKLETEAQAWRDKIQLLEDELQGSMKFVVKSIEGDLVSLRLYKDPRLPLSFDEAAAMEPERRRRFEALARQMVSEIMAGHTKELILTLKEPFKAVYRDLRDRMAQAPDRPAEQMAQAICQARPADERRRENRLLLLDRSDFLGLLAEGKHLHPQRLALPVKCDEILDAYFHDLSGVGASLWLNRQQHFLPLFKAGEKVHLTFGVGSESLALEMVVVDVEESSRLVRVGGSFVNLPAAQQAVLYKIKNALEARLYGQVEGRCPTPERARGQHAA